MVMQKRILITGGAGFIGYHLSKRLLDEGNEVICIDNLSSSAQANIEDLVLNPHFTFIEGDVTEPYHFDVDEIYNLACPASPIQYQKNPIKTTLTSILGATNALNLAKDLGIRVLQASTSEVYGDPAVYPQNESYWGNVNPVGARSCYDEGKRCAESLFFDYRRQFGVSIRVARIFNTYGPNMAEDDGRVVSNFIVQALKDENIQVHGDGLQTRSFQYVDDLVEGLIRLMRCEDDDLGPVNLGNPGEFTINELAEKVIRLIPESKSSVIYTKAAEDDPRQRRPDIDLAKRLLDWSPDIDLDQGLIRTIDYFRARHDQIINDKMPAVGA